MLSGFDDRWYLPPNDPAPFVALLNELAPSWRHLALKALVPDGPPLGSPAPRPTDGPIGWSDAQRATVLDVWLQGVPVSTMDPDLQHELRQRLIQATLHAHLPQMRVLLQHGITLAAIDEVTFTVPNGFAHDTVKDTGWTLLHLAAYKAQAAAVEILLARGEPVDTVSAGGLTVLHTLALALDVDDPQAPPGWRATADRLLEAGADRLVGACAPLLHNESVEGLVTLSESVADWAAAWEHVQLLRAANEAAPAAALSVREPRPRL